MRNLSITHLRLALLFTGDRYLVPAYVFELREGPAPVAVPAVPDRYLQ